MDAFHHRWQHSRRLSIVILFGILLVALGLSGPPRALAQGEITAQPTEPPSLEGTPTPPATEVPLETQLPPDAPTPADLSAENVEACTPITFGSTLAGAISTAGEVDCFTFSGSSGDQIRVRAIKTSGSLTPYHEISGVCPLTLNQERDCVLVASGTHTIQVKDFAGTNVGNYSIYVQRLNDPVGCTAIAFGALPLANSISVPAETDCFTFNGAANDSIRIRVIKTSGALTPYHDVIASVSGGVVLCSPTLSQERDCVLVASGKHTILVRDFAGPNTGNYSIYVQRLNNPVGCTAIAFGSTLPGAISVPAETDCYTFNGAANDSIRIRVVGTSGALTPFHEVIASVSGGVVLCSPTLSQERDCVLVASGTHTILVRDFAGPNTGNYRIYVQRLNNPVGCTAITFGALPLANSISGPAETDCFTFNGAANDSIRVRVVGTSGALTPFHDVIASAAGGVVLCSPTLSQERDCVLVGSGKHTILVRDFAGPNTGNYSIYVQRLDNPVGCTPISFSNLPRSGSITRAAETDCYTFNGAADDLVRIRVVRDSGTLTAFHEVVATDGTVLCSPTLSQERDCTLVNTGTHTILVRDFAGPNTGNYSIAILFTHTGSYDGWVVRSIAAQDGWVLESSETSNVGGPLNSNAVSFQVGDDAADRQYRAILSFNTAVLPDSATILSVVLKIRQQGAVMGVNPFTTHNGLRVDLRKPFFGAAANLESRDFQAAATANVVAIFNPTPAVGWYSAAFNAPGRNNINKTGTTQLRLQFGRDDDDDRVADFIRFFSGNTAEALRPILIIKYLP